jgi:hypothetical protein
MKKTLEEEDALLQAGTIETSEVESKDTLFWLMSTPETKFDFNLM